MSKKIKFGEWQLCPKCNGVGYIEDNQQYTNMTWTTGTIITPVIMTSTCNVCNGAKIIQRPLINKE